MTYFLETYLVKLLELVFHTLGKEFVSQPDVNTGNWFIANFIEWFGVLYGILLPLILVRTWEQLDDIDREFDREADTIVILYQDISFLTRNSAKVGKEITFLLRKYATHVFKHYKDETKPLKNETNETIVTDDDLEFIRKIIGRIQKLRMYKWLSSSASLFYRRLVFPIIDYLGISFFSTNDTNDTDDNRRVGDQILQEIRRVFKRLLDQRLVKDKATEIIVVELFQRLNEIIDIRGDRIAFASQRLFQSMRVVALVTTIIFVVPFYFVGFTPEARLLDNTLVIGVTLLAIFIYLIIDDLDEPYGGTWKIDSESWKIIRKEMILGEREQRLEKRGKKKGTPSNSKKSAKKTTSGKQPTVKKKSTTKNKPATKSDLSLAKKKGSRKTKSP